MRFCRRRLGSAFSFCLAKKKTLAKEKAPGWISNFPPDPLKATRKTTSVFLDLSCTGFRPGGIIVVHCTRKPNGTARRPSPTRKSGFSRRIPNIFVGDGLCAVPYAEIGIFTENSKQFRRGRPMCRPVVRTQANPYQLSNFIGSRLPHQLKRSCYQS